MTDKDTLQPSSACRSTGQVRPRLQPNHPDFDVTTASEKEAAAHETFLKYKCGHLTAVRGSSIPMTVNRVTHRGIVETLHFHKNKLIRGEYQPDLLIGAGPELIFAGGVFVRAQ